MSAVYQKHTKKYTDQRKQGVLNRQQKSMLPFSSRLLCLPFSLPHTLSSVSSILVRTLQIVNGFWFSWKKVEEEKLNKKNNNHFLSFGKEIELNMNPRFDFIHLSRPYTSSTAKCILKMHGNGHLNDFAYHFMFFEGGKKWMKYLARVLVFSVFCFDR